MKHWKALAAALMVPLVLAACLFVPGKFVSVMTIHADRSFTYSYKGEVLAVDVAGSGDEVDADTLFKIASNSKAMTAVAHTSKKPSTQR